MTRHPDELWPPDATRKAMEASEARAEPPDFEAMLADPDGQFDLKADLLASIDAWTNAKSGTMSAPSRAEVEESIARAEAAYRERYGPQEGPKRDAEATGGETGTRVTPVGFEGVSGDSVTELAQNAYAWSASNGMAPLHALRLFREAAGLLDAERRAEAAEAALADMKARVESLVGEPYVLADVLCHLYHDFDDTALTGFATDKGFVVSCALCKARAQGVLVSIRAALSGDPTEPMTEQRTYATDHGFTPPTGPFGGGDGCRVMLARYACPYSREEHDPSLPPVDVDAFGYRRPDATGDDHG